MTVTFLDLKNELQGSGAGQIVRPADVTSGRLGAALNKSAERLWDLEDWTFKRANTVVSATAGSSTITNLPADLGVATGLQRYDGEPLDWLDPDKFDLLYYDTLNPVGTGSPRHWTIDENGTVKVGPPADISSDLYKLAYLRRYVEMVADTDEPGQGYWPNAFRLTIALDAQVTWLKRTSTIYVWQPIADDVTTDLASMRRVYLTRARGVPRQWGAYSMGT